MALVANPIDLVFPSALQGRIVSAGGFLHDLQLEVKTGGVTNDDIDVSFEIPTFEDWYIRHARLRSGVADPFLETSIETIRPGAFWDNANPNFRDGLAFPFEIAGTTTTGAGFYLWDYAPNGDKGRSVDRENAESLAAIIDPLVHGGSTLRFLFTDVQSVAPVTVILNVWLEVVRYPFVQGGGKLPERIAR